MKSFAQQLTLATAALLTAFSTVRAADYTWTGAVDLAWDTTTANWSGAGSTWVNGSGNTASFGAFGANTSISLGTNITVGTLSTNGGSTINFIGGAGTSIDVTNINTAGGGNVGAIDMTKVIIGNHDLNYFGGGTGSSGRLNFKAANTYTGDTNLSGLAYVTLGSSTSIAYLPTTTTLNMGSTATTFRFGANNQSQEIAGLTSSGTGGNSAQILTTGVTGNTLKIKTKSGVTTTFTGTIANTMSLEISGSGTQALNGGSMSFTGATTVSGGTLRLGSNLSGTSSVTVNGGVLTSSVANVNLGTGAVSISSGEISARGNAAAGTFTLAANQNFTATGGKLTFNIGTASDQLKGSGTGTFSIGSGTEVALILGTGFSYASTYQLFDSFAGGSVAGTGVSITGYDTANWTAALSNTGVLSFVASSIPEPSTYAALAGAAFLGFATLRRRRA